MSLLKEGKHIGTFVGEDCSSVHKSLATVGIETLLSMVSCIGGGAA